MTGMHPRPRLGWHSAFLSAWAGTAGMERVAFPVAGTARNERPADPVAGRCRPRFFQLRFFHVAG
jgi:hypothetical protein